VLGRRGFAAMTQSFINIAPKSHIDGRTTIVKLCVLEPKARRPSRKAASS
jgi:hypothetical protein